MTMETKSELIQAIQDLSDNDSEFYYDHASDVLPLAESYLKGPCPAAQVLALKIIAQTLSEEDIDNWDVPTSFSSLIREMGDEGIFQKMIPSLLGLLSSPDLAPQVLYALWVCCRHGVKLNANPEFFKPFLDKAYSKRKCRDMGVRDLAFRLLAYSLCQTGQSGSLQPYVKGSALRREIFFEELQSVAAQDWDTAPFLDLACQNLKSKRESSWGGAVEILWSLVKRGYDISSAVPVLLENQDKLAMATDAMQVLAAFYVKTERHSDLEAWLSSENKKVAARCYRGLNMASQDGVEVSSVVANPKLKQKLQELFEDERLFLPKLNFMRGDEDSSDMSEPQRG